MILPILIAMFVCGLIVSWISNYIFHSRPDNWTGTAPSVSSERSGISVNEKWRKLCTIFIFVCAALASHYDFRHPFSSRDLFHIGKIFFTKCVRFFSLPTARNIPPLCGAWIILSLSSTTFFYFIHYICTSFYTYIQWDGKYNICPNSFVVRSLRLRLWLKPVTENERRPNYTRNNIAPGIDLISWFLVRLQSIS